MKRICVGIMAHVDAGKTTLSEGLLYTGGSIRQMGRVDNKDAFLDTYALEKERGITIFAKQAVIHGEGVDITLLDTPGHVDFSAEMERTLQVLDAAILVISAADGIQGHTLTLWNLLNRYQVPVFIFINKMDQEGSDKGALLNLCKEKLSSECVDFTTQNTTEFYDSVATSDEELLNDFLETGMVEQDKITRAVMNRKLFPCLFGSALRYTGVKEFLEVLTNYIQIPEYGKDFGAKVFKITRDDAGNRLTHLKVTGGSLKVRTSIQDEKINQIRIYSGTKYETVNEAEAGTVCAVTGLSEIRPGQGLGNEEDSMLPVLEPVLTYRILLPDDCKPAVFLPKLRLLEEEEPQLHIVWDEQLQEIQVLLMGEVQIEILKQLIWDRFAIAVSFDSGSIVYKETISDTVEGVGHFEPLRHYAEVHLLLEPLERGSGLVLETDCSEDLLNRNWQRLILTHLEEKEHKGVLTGAPITDMRITLVNGRAHVKHTEGGDFRQATYRAVRQGLMQAESVLLEPFYEFRLELPRGAVGRAMTDLEQMNGTFCLTEEGNEETAVLTGTAPVSCLRGYTTQVAAFTKGTGHLSCSYCGYGTCHNAEEVLKETQYDPVEDISNTPDSVFCSHGAGMVVPWYEVFQYMHVENRNGEGGQNKQEELRLLHRPQSSAQSLSYIDVEEIDRILNRTFYANRKEEPIAHKGISANRKKSFSTVAPSTTVYKPVAQREKYLLVDGYNVIFAWKELKELAEINIDGARGKLQDILCNYQAIRHDNVILVFDAYKITGHGTEYSDYHNIHLVYTREAETADQYIEHFAHENGRKYDVTVVTSDGLEQIIIRGQGCRLISSREFETEVEDALQELRTEYLSKMPEKAGKTYLLDGMSTEELEQIKEQKGNGHETR